jgi:(p)ppGpp synthase/HD superfamily hydrolase
MLHNQRIARAIRFSIRTHEIHQKQKRKGKDIPYVTHPLIVGLILARAGASEDEVIAGILHDTIEDSPSHKPVTREILAERFGGNVAALVDSVTEQHRDLPWDDRKRAALDHLAKGSHGTLLLKSADIISNTTELIDDYRKGGEATFARFNAPKDKTIGHTIKAIGAILKSWPENPLAADLRDRAAQLGEIAPDARDAGAGGGT